MVVSTSRSGRAGQVTKTNTMPDEGEPTELRHRISQIFAESQQATATQRKLAVKLRQIQMACCYEQDDGVETPFDAFDEAQFNGEVGRCVLRVLAVKKAEPVGDRVVRFLTLFLKFASEKDAILARDDDDAQADDDDDEDLPETPSSRLVTHILQLALRLVEAKDKTVRFRATQMVAQIVNTVDSVDDRLFKHIRLCLVRRLRDRESTVRVQAVLGLGRLADDDSGDVGNDDDGDDDADDGAGQTILARLLDALQHDPSADVRRALLLNLPFGPKTGPYLLERARDSDKTTRRAVYSRLLPSISDFRHLSLTHREKVLRWGLRDRDEPVRKAAAKLFCERWISDCAGPEGDDADGPRIGPLLELLERIDVINSGVDGGIGSDAMAHFWAGRPDYVDAVDFASGSFWEDVTAESAFVARTFAEHCHVTSDRRVRALAEDRLPELTRLAFVIKTLVAGLITSVQQVAECERVGEDATDAEEDAVQREFCVEQVLHIALLLDYSDEIGRRQMFAVVRETIALPDLPDECTRLAVEVVRTICGVSTNAEREFCGVVLEAVADVHDAIADASAGQKEGSDERDQAGDRGDAADASFHSARSGTPSHVAGVDDDDEENRAMRELIVNMKCLHIAKCMLQNLTVDIDGNGHLVTMLNTLVVPAVRSQDAPIRERGLDCLGLCCLLSQSLASENMALFLRCFVKGHAALQLIAIHTLSDVLLTFPALLGPVEASNPASENPVVRAVFKMYSRALNSAEPDVQTAAATAVAKLMLTSAIDDADLLKQLTMAYFDPDTRSNPALRQALAYFLPVYCRSAAGHAVNMARLAVPIVWRMLDRADELADADDNDGDIVGPAVVIGHLVDWTDPRNLIHVLDQDRDRNRNRDDDGDDDESTEPIIVSAHFLLADRIVDRLGTPGTSKTEKRSLVSMLGKLHLSETPGSTDPDRLAAVLDQGRHLIDLVTELLETASLEATSRNGLNKVLTTLEKVVVRVGDAVEGGGRTEVDGETEVGGGGGNGRDGDTDAGAESSDDHRQLGFGDGSILESSIIAPMSSLVISATSLS